jgi:uncharacterized protein YjdB
VKKNKILEFFRFRGVISIIFYVALGALVWYLIIPHTSFFFMKNMFTPFSKRLNKEDVTLLPGEEIRVFVVNINKRVHYSSSDIKVADVNIFGKVKAFRPGTTIIRVKFDKTVLKCRVRVIDINKDKVTLKVGRSKKLHVKGAWFGVKWTSSDRDIVIVNSFGKITAKSKGTVKIYGKIRGRTVVCVVRVK